MTEKRKLIEVALPLEAINDACRADKGRKTGTIRNLHKWFAPMPLPAWRALLAAAILDDPVTDDGRVQALRFIEDLVGSPSDEVGSELIRTARQKLAEALDDRLPTVVDPFCGGGSTLVEAQRLGLPSHGSDLNPIPALISRVLVELAPSVANRPPINPAAQSRLEWGEGLEGFLSDVRYYAAKVRDVVLQAVGHLYPAGPRGEVVIAWLWARNARCPNPACRGLTPLVTSYWLSKQRGKPMWLDPEVMNGGIRFDIASGDGSPDAVPKIGRSQFRCLLCGEPRLDQGYLRAQGEKSRLGVQLVAIAATKGGQRGFLPAEADWAPVDAAASEPLLQELPASPRYISPPLYGMKRHADLYTPRQAIALDAFAKAVADVPQLVSEDGGNRDYAAAIASVLGLCVGKLAQSNSTLVRWRLDSRNGAAKAEPAFGRHDIPMVWDFAETNPFGGSVGDWSQTVDTALRAFAQIDFSGPPATVLQLDARAVGGRFNGNALIATDPPYFDNIGYADLADYFYVWIRKALKDVQPDLFGTLLTPKSQELVANPYRHKGDKRAARSHFVEGFVETFRVLADASRPDLPMLVVYGFKQQESVLEGVASTGWDAILEAILTAGIAVVGTWPIRGAGATRQISLDSNSLADYIVLVLRRRVIGAPLATRKELLTALKAELPDALRHLQQGSIAPVDLAQAAIGPGMAVFSRFSRVVEADGSSMSVRTALELINQVLDETLAEQEADFDGDTRWAVAWFEQHGMNPGPFGVAETLSKAKNTAINGLVTAGILESRAGKVRLLDRTVLPEAWDPTTDARLTVWEVAQHLIRALELGGEKEAADLLRQVGGLGETARELAYRLYVICERKKWAKEALAYNALVVSWPEIFSPRRGSTSSERARTTGVALMAVTNHERVGKALTLLTEGLAPFVERECKAKYGEQWVSTVARLDPAGAQSGKGVSPTDAQFLLKVVWDEWQPVFRNVLGQTERTYVSELREVRNRWAHQDAFSGDDAYRALDSIHRLLLAVSAADEAVEVDHTRQDLLRSRFEEQARHTQRRAAVAPVEGQPTGGLKPWREVVTPHPDVASGRYQQAEFAADLHQVWRDEASDEYGKPIEFFRRTFLTDGLRELLLNAVRRFRKEGGDPVVELQTNFGGGKTHSMIALYHLADGYPPHELPGVEAMLAEAGLEAPPSANTAVLVGQMISPGVVYDKGSGVTVHTLWGELAWQLGGAAGYAMVADADRTGTSPGAALVDLLRGHSPCLVLIDEWVAYARQLYGVDGLPAGSFDAQFTFAQTLAEACRAVEGALLVVSIPASDIEVGGEGGRAALERLKNVIGRMESSWRPASAEEGFEIVRRRLFDDLPADSAPARDSVVKAFGNLYRSQPGEFPSECAEGDYERRLTAAYPIHPEMFDRLYGEWSTLDKFQRTRGVLRLMAAVVHELWERSDSSLLVMPATIPIDAPRVSSELTRYLEEGWTPVIESDIDGPNALPLRLDRDNPNLGRYSATRRVARTIYLGSAPTQQAANRGIEDRAIKLGCVQPGESPATFGDALRRLTDQATYLYVDGQRYWYSLQPSVTRLAQDRAASHFTDVDVEEEIRRRLAVATRPGQRGDFANVHPAPRNPAEVPDEQEVRLVVLGPENPHSGKTADSPARVEAQALLGKRAGGDRLHRNMLVFLAPDRTRLVELQQAAREFLAWKSIEGEKEALNLDNFQSKQAETKRAQFDEAVAQRIGETFVWVLVPSQTSSDPSVTWEEIRVMGPEPLAVRVGKKLRNDEALITEYSGARLRMDLDRVPLWRGDHVDLKQLWSDYTQYLYLPRLKDSAVLLDAVRSGVALLTWDPDSFAYAGTFDEETNRYSGLVAGQHAAVMLDPDSVLVKPSVAANQIDQERGGSEQPPSERLEETQGGATAPAGRPSDARDAQLPPSRPKRFYGRVSLEPVRMLRDLGDIADGIVGQLGRTDAEVTITVEIEATSDDGFTEEVSRTISENARTLKFQAHEFED